MMAEAWWILTGQNKLETIQRYSKQIKEFSDDGIFFMGAYGPKVVDQLPYILDSLVKDPSSRQAVLSIWRERPRSSRDIPCTLTLQFFIRDSRLHCCANMRSSDIWLGWPYDVFNFSMISKYLVELLNKDEELISLGNLYFTAGSQHLYDVNFEAANEIIKKYTPNELDKCWSDLNLVRSPVDNIFGIIENLDLVKDYDPDYAYSPNALSELMENTYAQKH
jgi:thymidylate synthase